MRLADVYYALQCLHRIAHTLDQGSYRAREADLVATALDMRK